MASLLAFMHDANQRVFSVDQAAKALKTDRQTASDLLRRGAERAVLSRLQSGVYSIVPSELGSERTYVGDPYVAGAALMRGKPYYISHGSALTLHELTTQPWLMVVISTPAAMRPRRLHGMKFRFVRIPERRFFGTETHWVAGSQQVIASDLEKTIIDCLTEPEYCGGYSEVDKAAWIAKARLNADKLVDYAIRLGRGAVIARLGFLLDSCQIGHERHRETLRGHLPKAYNVLDPTLPHEGSFSAKWRLRLNTSLEELSASRTT
jgi:predicted transcriptional regulator of viral defense system